VPKHLTLQDRILAWAKKTRAHAEELEDGPAKKAMLEKVALADKASALKLTFSDSDAAGCRATGQVTSERRRKAWGGGP